MCHLCVHIFVTFSVYNILTVIFLLKRHFNHSQLHGHTKLQTIRRQWLQLWPLKHVYVRKETRLRVLLQQKQGLKPTSSDSSSPDCIKSCLAKHLPAPKCLALAATATKAAGGSPADMAPHAYSPSPACMLPRPPPTCMHVPLSPACPSSLQACSPPPSRGCPALAPLPTSLPRSLLRQVGREAVVTVRSKKDYRHIYIYTCIYSSRQVPRPPSPPGDRILR